MKWNTEKRKLKDLIPYEKNPRIITDKQKQDLVKSLKKFSLVELPVINLDNKIVAGHQRLNILLDIYGPELEVDVRVPDELLNEKDFDEYLLRSNRNNADWDWGKLDDNWSSDFLIDVGFEDFEVNVDKIDLNKIFENMNKDTKTTTSKTICPCCNNKYKLKITILKLPVDELKDMEVRKEIGKEIGDFLIEKYPDGADMDIYVLKK